LLLHRRGEVLLVHFGGPLWARRDLWSIPKGEPDDGEDLLVCAQREWVEETGWPVPPGPYVPLGSVRQAGGKVVHAWAVEGDVDPATLVPGMFAMEWPKGSGAQREFPEVDRAQWFTLEDAAPRMVKAQVALLERLRALRS
jgi:predicted NUDIX family NTP pyrophosphohydrolase